MPAVNIGSRHLTTAVRMALTARFVLRKGEAANSETAHSAVIPAHSHTHRTRSGQKSCSETEASFAICYILSYFSKFVNRLI